MKAEIDHLANSVIDDDAIHQSHLAKGVVDLGGFGDPGQIFDQRRLFEVDVECRHVAVFQQQEFAQLPRNQRLADQRARRANDVDGRGVHHALFRAK